MTSAAASIVNLVASALAAIATAVLAIFAIRQWGVMKENNEAAKKQNELVRDRWRLEDAVRAGEDRPKAAFGLSDCLKCNLKLSCANLGTVGFLVVGMRIIPLLGDTEKILFGKGAEIFVPVGEEKQVTFDLDKYRVVHKQLNKTINGAFGRSRHLGIKLILQGPVETAETSLEAYRVHHHLEMAGSLYNSNGWRTISPPAQNCDEGFYGVREFVACPKCNNPCTVDLIADLGIVFPVEDCETAFEAGRNQMIAVTSYLEQNCPKHATSNSGAPSPESRNVPRDTLNV